MKILIIGSGLIGVTSAYYLLREGHDVMVLDRAEGPGRETSFANGALLTPSMAEPWNAPGSWRVLLASLVQTDSPMKLRLRAIPSLTAWGIQFLRNSEPSTFQRNALINLRFALHSLEVMKALREHTGVEYGRSAQGTIRLFRDQRSLEEAFAGAQRLLVHGVRFSRLSAAGVLNLEPSLRPIGAELAGAIHYETDETGNAYAFCVALADYARRQGATFHFRTPVTSLLIRSGRVVAAVAGSQNFIADRYVVAAGSYSTLLLRQARVRVPVRPAKGYSVTFEGANRQASLRIPMVDDRHHTVVVPIGDAVRVAGTAEFAGYDLATDPGRVRNLVTLARKVLPCAGLDPSGATPWCGLRAMSADGVPIIGATAVSNLFLNTGHGHLGWTLAAGSAKLLADLMSDVAPSVDPAPFSLSRFGEAR